MRKTNLALIGDQNSHVNHTIQHLMEENKKIQSKVTELLLDSMKAIVTALEERDPYTHGHSVRVMEYSLLIGKSLGLTDQELKDLELSAIFHDIGKIGIPDSILLKPGRLDKAEFEIMKTHPVKSSRIIEMISDFQSLVPAVLHHHERFDGLGYPDGQKGEEIPPHARIILLADTFDAMTSSRAYRNALNRQIAVKEIETCSGTQFDPYIAKHFLKLLYQEKDIEIFNPSRVA